MKSLARVIAGTMAMVLVSASGCQRRDGAEQTGVSVADYVQVLALDWSGDGIEVESIGDGSRFRFDYAGNGARIASEWPAEDDALLVWDRNQNGRIDDGSELVAWQAIQPAIKSDRLAALRQLDSNGDGVLDTQDADFARLALWRDSNRDAQVDADELSSLTQAGLNRLTLVASLNTPFTVGQRQVAHGGDASTAAVALYQVALGCNPFYRQFEPALDTSAFSDVPDIKGSGAVRDLREAASLSPALAEFARGLTGELESTQLKAQVRPLLALWIASAGFDTSFGLARRQGKQLIIAPPGVSAIEAYNAHFAQIERDRYLSFSDLSGQARWLKHDLNAVRAISDIRRQQQAIQQVLEAIETFNAGALVDLDAPGVNSTLSWTVANAPGSGRLQVGAATNSVAIVMLEPPRLKLFQESYAALESSVYSNLRRYLWWKPWRDLLGL